MAFKWTCPYCNIAQAVINNQCSSHFNKIEIDNQAEGMLATRVEAIGCSNPECLLTTVQVVLGKAYRPYPNFSDHVEMVPEQDDNTIMRLKPLGSSKPQPDFVPLAIREDYYEACLIRDLSPKASATLTRRCLQGMIRDFAKIAKARLVDEIDALRVAVLDGTADRSITPETIDAIDHVRGIGNIGAHMEKDIDLIVPVDKGEAQALIDLVEMLFDEWYGARHRRRERLARIENIAGNKKALKLMQKGTQGLLPSSKEDVP